MAEYEDTGEEFSYENDVAPLMGSYFKSLQSSGIDFNAQMRMLDAQRKRIQTEFADEATVRQRAQQVEITRLQLDEARRESSSKIGNMQKVAELQSILSNAMSDKVSDNDRPKLVSQIGIQYAPLIGTS